MENKVLYLTHFYFFCSYLFCPDKENGTEVETCIDLEHEEYQDKAKMPDPGLCKGCKQPLRYKSDKTFQIR